MNKEKGGLFFIAKCQIIKVEGLMELDNCHLGTIMIKVGLGKNHECILNLGGESMNRSRIFA